MEPLAHIKHLVLAGQYRFTRKAQDEMKEDGLTEVDVLESIVNAPSVQKVVRSRSRWRRRQREKLYVLHGVTFGGDVVYTKGTIRKDDGEERFYILISAKRAVYWRR